MIREPAVPLEPVRPRGVWLWLLFIALLICVTVWLGLRFYDILGLPAGILMTALGFMLIVAFLVVLNARIDPHKQSGGTIAQDGLADAFELAPYASLITREGKPMTANGTYMRLARELGVVGVSGTAPTIDQLLGSEDKDSTSAIFRLHHLEGDVSEAKELITRPDEQGLIRSFKVRVHAVTRESSGDQLQIWQVEEVSEEAGFQDGLLAQAPIGLFSVDQDGRILGTNPNLDMWIGAEDKGKPSHMREFIENPDVLLGSPRTPGRVVRADTRLITRKNVVTPTVMVAGWREVGGGRFIANVALHGHSSYGAPKMKAQVSAAQGESGSDFTDSPFAILELDSSDLSLARIRRANSAFETMNGGRGWQDRSFAEIFQKANGAPDFLSRDAKACLPGDPFDAMLEGKKPVAVSAYIVADRATDLCRVFLVDISARKSLEDQLVQSQKMQAIGRLTAEIAHDFNNLLAAMRLYTDTLLGRHPIGDPSYPELQQINSNVNRAAALVKKLLAYSRKQTLRAVKLDVTETLSDMAITLKQMLGERVNLDIIHGRDLPPIKVDKTQLDTVLMNLAVNARDAMKGQGGGKISIESKSVTKTQVAAGGLRQALDGINADDFVVISVTDTGTGITDEIMSKIFEPFFTTKPQGEGTGLGLSTVYGIVQQSGGHLDVKSKLGVGTSFRIFLPAFTGKDEDITEEKKPEKAVRRPADLAGQGNILFVEDEDSVRVIAAKTLRKRGYKVVEACDGEEAYEILEDTETPFNLLISDVVMPGMDGPTLLKKARHMLGDARIVFISGYAEEEFSDLLSEEPDVTFLPKPFSLIELAEKVKAEIGVAEN